MSGYQQRRPSLLARIASISFIFLLLSSCATAPLPKTLALRHPPRLGIIGFKVTAPIQRLSSIFDVKKKLDEKDERARIDEVLRKIEKRADEFLVSELVERKKVEPVLIPDGAFGTHRGVRPLQSQIALIRKNFGVDAILYGEIPWYGRTRLIYPILGMTADILAESVIINTLTHSESLVLANIAFDLITSTPLWFGGAYIFGLAFRPVTVKAIALSVVDGKNVWSETIDRIVDRKILTTYPEQERSKKEIQLEVSLHSAMKAVALSLAGASPEKQEEEDEMEYP